MKKSIQKPSNWQDFESLCKMLWGEMWSISDKIKQNGRLGQSQAGVDVYGIPKGNDRYSGIQCKGKNDDLQSKLTTKEIDIEIENAKTFKPELETFIFATTSNKDVKLEQYVREKDIENRKNGGFEILLYCWEDIADLIETNRNTFNYYVLNNQFKSNYEFDLNFADGSKIYTATPKYKKIKTKYILKTDPEIELEKNALASMGIYSGTFADLPRSAFFAKTNYSWIKVNLIFTNTGSLVIEDYKIKIEPEFEKIREMNSSLNASGIAVHHMPNDPFYVYEDEKYGVYKRRDNAPLIQKDPKSISFYILANHDVSEIKLKCTLLARDFNLEEALTILIDPTFETTTKTIKVDKKEDLKLESTMIEDCVR